MRISLTGASGFVGCNIAKVLTDRHGDDVFAERVDMTDREAVRHHVVDHRPDAIIHCAILNDWDRMVAFYELPKEHWRGLRTTNVVESPFQVVRLRTGAARRFKKVKNATAVIWKLLMIAETNFKTFFAVHHLKDVASGGEYVNGEPKPETRSKVA